MPVFRPTRSASNSFSASDIEIEHILPRSRTLDDSAANKVLCFRDDEPRSSAASRRSRPSATRRNGRTSLARAEKLPPNKRWRFKPDAMKRFDKDGGFLARQLNETKHLSRLAKAYLGKVCDPDEIYVTPGTLTGLLRGKWGLNGLLGDDNRKNRTDHRHHADRRDRDRRDDALPACNICRARPGAPRRPNSMRPRQDPCRRSSGFRDAVRASIEKLIVSNKPEHGKSGRAARGHRLRA